MTITASTSTRTARRARQRAAAAICAAALALTGCSAGSSESTQSSKIVEGGAAPADQAAAPAPAQEQQGKDATAKAPDLSVDQRSIIYTGSITLRVENVSTAAARVTGIVTGAGGFIGGDKRSSSGEGPADATLTLRVPADKFQAVVDQVAGLGKEEQRGINTEDVTEQSVDLQARIATQQARVDSGRKLLAQAKSLDDLISLEREVASRESDLASLQAKQRRLADLTALSTITVVLLDPKATDTPKEEDPAGFLTGLKNGWGGLLTSLGVMATVLGWLLPWLLLFGLPVWAAIYFVRRRKSRPVLAPAPAESK
ncbi:DUF4349 domain-containing protein [Actinoplanes sp. NPDC051859]|uniref:DUF4349 domain-containing protein n=1 Tax=Actinoplanes sp. NPDC051859 TaxID=3363909 RepID=UPI00378E9F8D